MLRKVIYHGSFETRGRKLSSSESESETDSEIRDLMEGPGANEFNFVEKSYTEKLLKGINEFRKEGAFCDIIIEVENRKFPAHKNVLSAFSPFFKAMFQSQLAESRQKYVSLKEVDSDMVELLLEYAYTGTATITKSNVQALLSASNLLQITPVKDACCQFLERHMDASNCLGIHSFAEHHSCNDLQEKAFNYALMNFGQVSQHEEFLSLTPEKLIELTSSDRLEVTKEESVFQAIAKWYNFKPDTREINFDSILETVRLPLLSPYFLLDVVSKMPAVSSNEKCLSLVEEAKIYHLLPDKRQELRSQRSKLRLSSDLIEVIVAVGGEDDKVVLRCVECFCLVSMTWKSLAPLPFAISKHGLAASGKNTLYMAGGEFPDGGASNGVWRYDPVLNCWQEVKSMKVARSELGLAMLDGYLYAVGGWEGQNRLDTVERYDPSSNSWSFIKSMEIALTSAAVIAHDGMLYVTGGAVYEDGDGINLVQRYDPHNEAWTNMSPMKIPRSGAAICALDNHIYVCGGWHASTENTNRVECYDVKNDKWEFKCPMREKRYRPGISVMDGKIYVLGGEEGWDKYHDSIERYDPATDTWVICGVMPSSRSWLGCAPFQVRKSLCKS